ncbi:hypothetical protein ACFL3V_05360 [Nanoarchaeota archaeon]
MVNKKIITVLSLVLALMLITGCGSFQRGKGEPPVSAQFTATGTQGLVMNFLPDQPPAKVYTQGSLTFLIEVWNKGTYTVPSATFYLSGFDPNLLPGLPNNYLLSGELESKSQFNPEGGYTTLDFSTPTLSLPTSMPNYKPTFLLTACYPYHTVATPLICIDPNPMDTTSDKACRTQKVYSTGSQGAPVAVQSIEAEARPTGMFFRIHIANTAGGTQQASGTVFRDSMMNACPGGLSYSDLNVMAYEVDITGQPLDCDPKSSGTNEIRLVNNKATIFCRYPTTSSSSALSYQTALNVRLRYGYKSSVSKIVEIENLNFAR